MGGAPYLAMVYRNCGNVVHLAGRFSGLTKDPVALQRCHHLMQQAKMERSDDANAPKIAVQDALWRAEVGFLKNTEKMTLNVDILPIKTNEDVFHITQSFKIICRKMYENVIHS